MAQGLEPARCPACGGPNILMGICCKCGARLPPDVTRAMYAGARRPIPAAGMDDEARLEVANRLRARDSGDLVTLLRQHDEDEWQPEVFEIARSLLIERGIDLDAALAESSAHEDSPQQAEDLQVMATFSTPVDAEPCRAALTAAGFDVFVLDENAVAVDPALWPALGGVKIAVPSDQAVEAREFLEAADRGDLSTGPEVGIQCSRCGSSRVRFVTHVDRLGSLATSLIAGVVARSGEASYVCDDCGATAS